jgi:OHCU decarboxylase
MSDAMLTVDQVNALDEGGFVATFAHVYEDTPSLAAEAWPRRPFADRSALVATFRAVAEQLDDDAVLALLRAHPQLAASGPMATSSRDEQRAAGLTTADERTRDEIRSGNARYLERFGFPFILAVQGLQPTGIAASLAERLGHDPEVERATALQQVQRIAELRIARIVAP